MFNHMKRLEVSMPDAKDFALLARIQRLNFHCIRDDFLAAWHEHEEFLVYYEERLTKSLIRQAKISEFAMTGSIGRSYRDDSLWNSNSQHRYHRRGSRVFDLESPDIDVRGQRK